jgi:hypothetical protein
MIGWLIQKWCNWRTNKSREIFRFWDGQRITSRDPMVLWIDLKNDPEFLLERHPKLIDAGDDEAIKLGVRAVQRVFGVKAMEHGGLTHLESINLLGAFLDYMAGLKKSTSPTPTSPAPSESPPLEPSITSAA